MSVKTINNITRPDSLIPTLLVFGTFPRISLNNMTSATTVKRGKAIKKIIKKVTELHTKKHVNKALRTRNRPNITDVLGLAIGQDVLVWRENKGWDGPYILLLIDGHNCTIKLPSGPTTF